MSTPWIIAVTVASTLFSVLAIILAAYGVNVLSRYKLATGKPLVHGRIIPNPDTHDIRIRFETSGRATGVHIFFVLISKEQIKEARSFPPKFFNEVITKHPLHINADHFCFSPFEMPSISAIDSEWASHDDYMKVRRVDEKSREQVCEHEMQYASAHAWTLWQGCFPIRKDAENILTIPCELPLKQNLRMAFKYRYRVGVLLSEEYCSLDRSEENA